MITVSITVSNSRQVQARLRKLGPQLKDFTAAMKLIGKDLGKYYSGVAFASRGGVYGTPWPELSPAYAVRKAKEYPGRGILVRQGTMQNSYISQSNSTSVLITNSAPHFVYHESPEEPRTRIPRRQTIGDNNAVRRIIIDILTNDINRKMKGL